MLSADNVKVLNDERIVLEHQPRHGVNITIVNLRGEDSGLYKCTLNFNKKALQVKHKLQVEGEKLLNIGLLFNQIFSCSLHHITGASSYDKCETGIPSTS